MQSTTFFSRPRIRPQTQAFGLVAKSKPGPRSLPQNRFSSDEVIQLLISSSISVMCASTNATTWRRALQYDFDFTFGINANLLSNTKIYIQKDQCQTNKTKVILEL